MVEKIADFALSNGSNIDIFFLLIYNARGGHVRVKNFSLNAFNVTHKEREAPFSKRRRS
jgi:hypothetical protein